MNKKKKCIRTLYDIGRRQYDFDYRKEVQIYFYLCRSYQKNSIVKKLPSELKFGSYKAWKQYIYEKYKDYNSDELREFSRYLNQGIRDIKPDKEYMQMVIPVIFVWMITDLIEIIFLDTSSLQFNSILEAIGYSLIVLLIVVAAMVFMFLCLNGEVCGKNMKENLFVDYKEIIDSMIVKKECTSESFEENNTRN